MRRFAEPALWALLLATAGTVPLAAALAVAGLVVVTVARSPARAFRRLVRRTTRVWPAALLGSVVVLAALQARSGMPWTDLVGLVVWGAVLAVVLPGGGAREATARARVRDGVLVGSSLAVLWHVAAAGPELLTWFGGGAARAAGGTGHPNVLAPALLLVAATLAVSTRGADGARRVMALGALVPALLLVLASGSRAAALGAVVGVGVWFAMSFARRRDGGAQARGARRWTAVAVLAAAIVVPLVLASVRSLPLEQLVAGEVERATVFSVALDLAAARPVLGHGGAHFAQLVVSAEPALPWFLFSHPHAVPLHVLVHGGAVGSALAALLLGFGLRALRPWWREAMAERGPAPPMLAAAAGALALQALVDVGVIDPAVYLAAAGLLAALVCTSRRYHPAR